MSVTPPPGTPGQPATPDGAPAPAADAPSERPTGWIIAVVILALIAIGLGVWAITTNSDLDSANKKVAQQKAVIATGSKDIRAEAKNAKFVEDKELVEYRRTRQVLRKNQKTVAQQKVNIAKQKRDVATAQTQLDDASTQQQKTEAKLNLTEQKLQVAQACQAGTVSAIDSVFAAPNAKVAIHRLNLELASLSKDCGQTVG
jgi:hypothetical protein